MQPWAMRRQRTQANLGQKTATRDPGDKVLPFDVDAESQQRNRVEAEDARDEDDGEISEAEPDEDDPPLNEPPTSWHHAVRQKALMHSTGRSHRCYWITSAYVLVGIQFLVMLSFNSALSIKRCTSHGDCPTASHCAGLHYLARARDPRAPGKYIDRGICQGCGTRFPDEETVEDLLEINCPPASNGTACLLQCLTACAAHGTAAKATATWKELEKKHLDEYTQGELTCATGCAHSCYDGLPPEQHTAFATLMKGATPISEYGAWKSLKTQCDVCPASVRDGYRYSTPAEQEDLRLLNMSFFDFVTLGLASLIVALTMMREIRDINIGQMMTLQAVRRDRKLKREQPGAKPELTPSHLLLRRTLGVLVFVRRYCILPDVGVVCVLMVARFGGDSVSILLNTLAALFMLELDNLAFDFGLSAETKVRVEEDFKVVLGKEQIGLLRVSRRWHVVSLTCAFVGLVAGIPAIHTVWGRMRCVSITIIVIVSIGEVIEFAKRMHKRTARSNAERLIFLVVKVALAVLYKWYHPTFMYHVSLASFVW